MDGHRQMENPLPELQKLAGLAVFIGFCAVFWLAVYHLVMNALRVWLF
jgi:hypothetical protein